MKSKAFPGIAVVVLLAALAIPAGLAAQGNGAGNSLHRRYRLIDLGTFGGPQSYVNIPINYAQVLNDRGTVAGWADTSVPDPYPDFCFDPDCLIANAFRTQDGVKVNLGTLPGGASSQADWISSNGLIAGFSQNGEIDPLVPLFPELRAVLWNNGGILDLGTLEGGYESIANAVNIRSQVVGFATNTIPDPNSMFGLGYQTRAFVWERGSMRDLGTLGGNDAVALLINERGQIAGISYKDSEPSDACAGADLGSLTTGAFLWTNGTMRDLGNFGGTCTFAADLNDRGQVVGGSFLAGDQASHPFLWDGAQLIDLGTFGGDLGEAIAINEPGDSVGFATYPGNEVVHAALWRQGRLTDLGTLDGDALSVAFDINKQGQVIGVSVPPGGEFDNGRAFLWQAGGPIIDLNSLIPPGSSLRLTQPETINNRGEIAGVGLDAGGNQHAFLLIPCDGSCVGGPAGSPGATQGNSGLSMQNVSSMISSKNLLQIQRTPMRRVFRRRLVYESQTHERKVAANEGHSEARGASQAASTDFLSCAAGDLSDGTTDAPLLSYPGHCIVSGVNLTGACVGVCGPGGYCCTRTDLVHCPTFQRAKNPGYEHCRNGYFRVDFDTSCSQ